MVKTLIKHGNSLALVIDKSILELLRVTADTPLELTSNGESLLVKPVRSKGRAARLRKIIDEIHEDYDDDLRRLSK